MQYTPIQFVLWLYAFKMENAYAGLNIERLSAFALSKKGMDLFH